MAMTHSRRAWILMTSEETRSSLFEAPPKAHFIRRLPPSAKPECVPFCVHTHEGVRKPSERFHSGDSTAVVSVCREGVRHAAVATASSRRGIIVAPTATTAVVVVIVAAAAIVVAPATTAAAVIPVASAATTATTTAASSQAQPTPALHKQPTKSTLAPAEHNRNCQQFFFRTRRVERRSQPRCLQLGHQCCHSCSASR